MTTVASNHRTVHKRQPRLEGTAKVTGATLYTGDIGFPDMVHAKLLRSPHGHALIKKLDVSAALRHPGVVDVFTAADLPAHLGRDTANRLNTIFADKEVMFFGQPVAAVVAPDPAVAEEALDLITVEYEPLPVVMDILEALKTDAPPVRHSMEGIDRSELKAHTTVADSEEEEPQLSPNITHRLVWSRGDVETAIKEADVVVTRSYRAQWVHQGYIEPMGAVVDCDLNGDYRVWTSTQGNFPTREDLAKVLGVPETKVVVEYMEMGGGFGGKIKPYAAAIPAIIARKLRRPVKFVMSRSEDLRGADPAPGAHFDITTAAKKDGTLTALKARAIYDSGSFPGSPLMAGANLLGSYYKTDNLEIEGIEVITNRVSQGALRAPGTPQATFAIESNMDIMAEELGMDPLELRLKNAVTQGSMMANGRPFGKVGLIEVLHAMKETNFWKNRTKRDGVAADKQVGWGIAVGGWLGGSAPSSASVMLNSDGTVSVLMGASDISGTNTSFAMIVAEELGLPLDRVSIRSGSTATSPYAGFSAGSKTLRTVGLSVQQAAIDVRNQMFKIVSQRLECNPDDLECVDGEVRVKGSPEKSLSFQVLGNMSTSFGSPVPVIIGKGQQGSPPMAPGFALQGVKVAVDPETGLVEVLDVVCVQDVGFAVNPLAVESQIQGGVTQSLAIGFSEELVWDDQGILRNPTLLDYRIPTALDIPNIETVLVEVPVEGAGPFGAKGVGEPPIAAGCAALINAVHNAVGGRVYEMPATAERVLRSMGKLN